LKDSGESTEYQTLTAATIIIVQLFIVAYRKDNKI
jgi:hypothetical protein